MAIFGYCEVRYFADAVKVLQEDVLILINEIAEIVHSTVEFFDGCVNKNLGRGFLIIWKLPKEAIQNQDSLKKIKLRATPQVHQIADMALVSFLKLAIKIKKSKNLHQVGAALFTVSSRWTRKCCG